ncbi:signal peptidase I [Saccharopolyspora sp. HNM0983]|uniref:Signal peptidase I n=2 Tax=Saccharopolyspora montiporae TaxID=2781240 RepID=A0A929G026_9PSEU|nr:signal peptidase I [Saccharopolyspora sp. HNM0983]MBE9374377.1 signal peptidase I [Saccharopolyspora sp. HNM0983]
MRSTGPEEEPQGSQYPGGAAEEPRRRSRRGRSGDGKKGSFWRELPILIVTALVLTVLIQAFVARVYVIPSQSMEETLHGCPGCNNDRVLVDKISYRFGDPSPGDVVVFRGPQAWGQNEFQTPETTNPVVGFFQQVTSLLGFGAPDEKDFVKRVVAVGGQTVECCDTQNRVLVDGEPLNEPYIHWEPGRGVGQEEFESVTVPPGHLWVMGDNRNDSADSRVQGGGGPAGAVPVDNVIGKAQVIVLPPTRWQNIPEPDPQAQALAAPGWQAGVPLGVGVAAAFPVVRAGRKLVGEATDRRSQELH